MRRTRRRFLVLPAAMAALALSASVAPAQKVEHLCDFESPSDLKAWSFTAGTPELIDRDVAHGRRALKIAFDPEGRYHPAYLTWNRVRRDWSPYDALLLDVTNPGDKPMSGYVLIADRAWADKNRSYWNRHNGSAVFAPGRTTWVIPIGGLYRGEAGSRNNDIKRNIDADSIVRLDFGFGRKGAAGSVIIDDLRLVKVSRPPGVWAFDFGPSDQSVMLGWTAVSDRTGYDADRGFGWGPAGGRPWDGAARDTTFGPPLTRDFCEAGGYRFRVDVPAGRCAVTLIYENSGYWGGEQAMHSRRAVRVDGREVWSETRADGRAHALYRFENVEPVGVDLWDAYMAAELAKPVRFEAVAGDDGLTLQFEADHRWGSRLAAMVVRRADDREAQRWIAAQLDELEAEFRKRAVRLDEPGAAFEPPTAWRPLGVTAWPVELSQDVTPESVPADSAPDPDAIELRALAARNEAATLSLAVRSGKTHPPAAIRFDWTDAPADLPAELLRVWYNTRRGFNSIAWRIGPHTLRACERLPLDAGVTRQLVLTVRVPADAPPGEYVGRLMLDAPGGVLVVPVRLEVSPVVVDRRTEFRMGFYGLMPPSLLPDERRRIALEQTLDMLRDYGMNTVCGGPSWRLEGWKDGQPVIDFSAVDAFMETLKRHGFTGPVNGYGGLRFAGLHERYQAGRAAEKVARESGLPYAEAFMRAWRAVHEHARARNWPVIWYAMCDETRVREVAERELEFMKLMATVSKAFPDTVRTSGSYSVTFTSRPTDRDSLLYWHQRFFEALDISDLNRHDPSVLAEARRLGKEVHIYNQGRSRYSFGLYQWSELGKGIRARTQWHLNILHGYQFFDLDGREPDNAMICYGREGLYPTIDFERCREGAQDFYLYQTLARAVEQARAEGHSDPAVETAGDLLDSLTAGIELNRRFPPEGYDPDAIKARVLAAIEALTDDE